MTRVLVVLRSGPATERSWLGLRTALSLGLAGHDVEVALRGDAAGLALPLAARAWLGGDPGAELLGLVQELGSTVLVDAAALSAAGAGAAQLAPGCVAADGDSYAQAVSAAEMLVAF